MRFKRLFSQTQQSAPAETGQRLLTYLFTADPLDCRQVMAFIEAGADLSQRDAAHGNMTALLALASQPKWEGQIKAAEAMIGRSAPLDAREDKEGMTALMLAVRRGHIELVQALLKKYADATLQNAAGQTAKDIALAAKASGEAVPNIDAIILLLDAAPKKPRVTERQNPVPVSHH